MKSRKPKRKNRNFIFRIVLLSFLLFFIFLTVKDQSYLNNVLKPELSKKQKQISDEKLDINELKDLLANGSEADFIERFARDKLDFVFADEQIYEDRAGR